MELLEIPDTEALILNSLTLDVPDQQSRSIWTLRRSRPCTTVRLRHQFIFGQPLAVPLSLLPREVRAFELQWDWKRQKLTSGVRYSLLQLLTKESNLNSAH